jgi:hypothetical protein
MMNDDRELARLLAELRRSDEASAPGFRNVLARPRARPRRLRLSLLRIATAVVLLGLIGAAIRLARRPSPEIRLEAAARAIAEWKAPTDSLLHTPRSALLDSIPQLATPVPNYSTLEAAWPEREATPALRQ